MILSGKFKKSYYSQFSVLALMIVDALMIVAAFKSMYVLNGLGQYLSSPYLSLCVISILSWIVAGLFADIYKVENLLRFRKILLSSLVGFLFHVFIISIYLFTFKVYNYPLDFLIRIYSVALLLIILSKFLLLELYRYFESLEFNRKNVIIVGYTPRGKELSEFFKKDKTLAYNVKGFFDETFETYHEKNEIKGNLDDIKSFCIREDIDEIYYTLSNNSECVKDLSRFADDNFIHFGVVQDFEGFRYKKLDARLYDDGKIPILTPRKEPLRFFFNRQVKRTFDIFFSLGVILFIFPILLPVIAVLIKLNSKGPVFFKQLRTGRNGKPFVCYKFRTMTVNSEANSKQAEKNDARITKIGAILRKTSLDEFPQFFNVLIGDMSVVGPRPHMLKHTEEYSEIISDFKIRHFITSGITGYAQIKGYRGETKETEQMAARVMLDNWYLENWSLTLDIKIIFFTVWNALRGEKNAY